MNFILPIVSSFLRRQESVKNERERIFYLKRVKRKATIFLVSIILMLISQQGHSQGMIAPPSPNAQALARYAAVPVSYYTGTPAINVPIYTLAGKELSMPISLSYNASGHKVKDIASWVGLGWSLNAGGVITRMVRGLPDEDVNGYCGNSAIGYKAVNPYAMNVSDRADYFSNVLAGNWDGEPDMFYFNFMGRSGRFMIAPNGVPYSIPYQNLSIKPGICSSGSAEWIITDENGTRYIFGSNTNSRENSFTKYISTSSTITKSYISSWYLSRIESANGTDNIHLIYQKKASIVQKYRTNYEVNCWGNSNDCSIIPEGESNQRVEVTTSPLYLSKIWNNWGSVNFIIDKNTRDDLDGAHRLKSIIIKENGINIIKSFQLSHDYFSSGCSSQECKRLKLNGVLEGWQPLVNFIYDETVNLPSRNSYSFDHWGYANNSTSPNGIGQKYPDATKMMGNSIKEISYPQGAKTIFVFEPHDRSYTSYYNGNYTRYNLTVGGLRVKSITVDDGVSSNTKTFSYSIFSDPSISSGTIFKIPNYEETITGVYYGGCTKKYSSSVSSLFDLGGAHIGYGNVTESTEFAKTTYRFTTFNSNPDGNNPITALGGWTIYDDNHPPHVPGDYFGWERGLLLDKTIKTSSGKKIEVILNEYDFNTTVIKELNGVLVGPFGIDWLKCNWTDFAVGFYTLTSKPFYLLKTTTETYEQENNANKSTTIQEFLYNNEGQLSETLSYNLAQSTSKQITKTKYINHPDYSWSAAQQCVDDYHNCMNNPEIEIDNCGDTYYYCISNPPVAGTDAKAILDLRTKHAINVPVEQLNIIQEGGTQYLVGATYTKFKTQGASNQMVVPYKSYIMDELMPYTGYQSSSINDNGNFIEPVVSGSSYKLAGTSHFSTSNGQLTSQTGNDGTTTAYTYNTNGILASTSTTNGSLNTTASQVVAPLVGVTQKTDANGRQVNYTYDKKGRLKYVKDHDGNVVTRYRYNTEAPLTSEIEATGSFMAGTPINLKAINPFDHGVSTITWGFGDGSIAENSTESVSHVFASGRSYSVSFMISNPEYELLSVFKNISIYNPMSSGTILSNGNPILSLNLCEISEKTYNNLSAQVSGGCGNKTYVWKLKVNSGNWMSLNPMNGFIIYTAGTYTIHCKITDDCGNTFDVYEYVSATQNCGGGGGGLPEFPRIR